MRAAERKARSAMPATSRMSTAARHSMASTPIRSSADTACSPERKSVVTSVCDSRGPRSGDPLLAPLRGRPGHRFLSRDSQPVSASSADRAWSTSGVSDFCQAGRSTDNVSQVSSRLIWSYWWMMKFRWRRPVPIRRRRGRARRAGTTGSRLRRASSSASPPLPAGGHQRGTHPCHARQSAQTDRASHRRAAVPWQPPDPSQQHRVTPDVIVHLRFQTAVRDEVDLPAEDLLDQLLEPDERERRRAWRRVHEKVDVRVLTRLAASDRAEHCQPPVAILRRQSLEDRSSRIKKLLGTDGLKVARVPELLTDRWLRNTQRIADLLLAHPRGDHRAKRDDTTQPRDILVASRIPILRQQGHKTILSLSPCPVESVILALRIRKRGTVSIFGGTSADLQQRTPLGRTPLEFDIWGNEVGDVRGSI